MVATGEALAADYFRHLGARALEVRPAILGHFDIIKYLNDGGALYDAASPLVRRAQAGGAGRYTRQWCAPGG